MRDGRSPATEAITGVNNDVSWMRNAACVAVVNCKPRVWTAVAPKFLEEGGQEGEGGVAGPIVRPWLQTRRGAAPPPRLPRAQLQAPDDDGVAWVCEPCLRAGQRRGSCDAGCRGSPTAARDLGVAAAIAAALLLLGAAAA